MSIAPERCRLVFQKLERDLEKLSSEQRVETVHRFRTGTRRLQTLLEEVVPERDRNQKKLLKMLGRIRKRAGRVRDSDVQLAALRELKTPEDPRRKTRLMHNLIDLRATHERKLRKLLSKDDVRDIRKRLRRAAKALNLESVRDPLTTAREMLARVADAEARPTEDLLHQYRILSKRARYAAEFAVQSPEADQFIAQVERLQDTLGDWHDWLTLTQTAANRLGDVRDSSLVAALRNVTGAKFRNAVAALSKLHPPKGASKPVTPQPIDPRKRGAETSAPFPSATSAA